MCSQTSYTAFQDKGTYISLNRATSSLFYADLAEIVGSTVGMAKGL